MTVDIDALAAKALAEALEARSELRKSGAWQTYGKSPVTHIFKSGAHLDALIAELHDLVVALKPPPPPPPSAPVYMLTLTPNYVSSQDDPAKNYQGVWVYATSPTTPYVPPNGRDPVSRHLLLDPRMKDAKGVAGCDEWWFNVRRLWPSSFDPMRHGDWGTEWNMHNVAGDRGPNGGVGWGFGNAVSALGLLWLKDQAPVIHCEPAASGGKSWALPVPTRDVLHEYLVHMVAGRTDGSTLRPGLLECWADGKLVFSEAVDTVQRANGYTQAWMQGWDGDYTRAIPAPSTVGFALTQYGRTRDECLADVPRFLDSNISSYSWRRVAPDLGPPTLVKP